MKHVALLLSGNIRTFFYNDYYIAKTYADLVYNQNIDVFIYTDNNDFNFNNVQYHLIWLMDFFVIMKIKLMLVMHGMLLMKKILKILEINII